MEEFQSGKGRFINTINELLNTRFSQLSYTTEQGKIVNHFGCCLFENLEQQG
jgi:hypothetical protein